MSVKNDRQQTISEIISGSKVSSQEQLLSMLSDRGVEATQATLSRDLREMGISKVSDPQVGYYYSMPRTESSKGIGISVHPAGVLSIEFGSVGAVVKTTPGLANAVALTIDSIDSRYIMGTIAGDDTILLILRDGSPPQAVVGELAQVVPGISDKLSV